MAVPKKKTSKAKGRSRQAANWRLGPPARCVCPHCQTVLGVGFDPFAMNPDLVGDVGGRATAKKS